MSVNNPIDDSFLCRARRASFSGPILTRWTDVLYRPCHNGAVPSLQLSVSVSDGMLRAHELLDGSAERLAVVERIARVQHVQAGALRWAELLCVGSGGYK